MTPRDERADTFDSTIWEVDEKTEKIEGIGADGKPDPAYAAALGLIRAPFGRRALALACDVAAWLVVQLPLWFGAVPLLLKLATGAISPYGLLNHSSFVLAVICTAVTVVLTLVLSIVQLVLHGRKGMTIGKAIAGIRSVNVRTLERPKVGPTLLRYLIVYFSSIVPVLGPAAFMASSMFDRGGRGRGWHDKATGVWLVDVREGLQPFDEKRMRVARKMVKAEPMQGRSVLPSLATPTDPAVQSEYRPGSRVSAGVLGIARPYEAHERPVIGLAHAAEPTQIGPVEAGKPVLGGYRIAKADESDQSADVQTAGSDARPQRSLRAEPAPAPVPQAAPVQRPAPVPQPAPAPAPDPAPAPAPVPPPAAAAPQHFGLRLDTGESILVAQPLLLGRNPDATGHPGAQAIALADDSRSLSKTHMLVRPVAGGLEITDCHSTNGSGLIRAGAEYSVAADTPILTIDGDTIRLGDRMAAVVQL